MKIESLSLPQFRGVERLHVEFDSSQDTVVLLGRNGSGKSRLMRVLVAIFRDLEAGAAPPFPYQITYTCRGRRVSLDADPGRSTRRLRVTVDGQTMAAAQFLRSSDILLPTYIFAYYSGWSGQLEHEFDRPTRQFYSKVLKSPSGEMPLRRLFFCRKEYSQLVLLAFFLTFDGRAKELLQRYLRVDSFVSVLFVLKRPWWGESAPQAARPGDEEAESFWNARGAFVGFLERIWSLALAPIRFQESVERDVRRQGEATERLHLYIRDLQDLAAVQDGGGPREFFANLESLFLCDLIDEVRVRVRLVDGSEVSFSEMSEGEQQLLTVLGLLLFTQDEESLYLLDEPDTHLNPVWTYQYLGLLQENLSAGRSQLIVSSHNPLMVGALHREQVRVLWTQDGLTSAREPEYDPIGIGVEGLLKSELYGLRSTLAPEVLGKLDRHYALLGKHERSVDEDLDLRLLTRELNEMAISRTHPNPYFEAFATALANRRSSTLEAVLTPEEIEAQAELADEILQEVLAAEKITGLNE